MGLGFLGGFGNATGGGGASAGGGAKLTCMVVGGMAALSKFILGKAKKRIRPCTNKENTMANSVLRSTWMRSHTLGINARFSGVR